MSLRAIKRTGTLFALTGIEMLAPFIRMMILSHILGGFELGFSAALSAAYATVEQITDTGLFRFVLATPREDYRLALATAHGIALVRGLIVALIFLLLAYPTGCSMVSCGQWASFAWLAPLTLIKSGENIELRVYERDYRYRPQLIASIASHSCGLLAMLVVGLKTESHYALIAYLFVQSAVYVILSHVLTDTRTQIKFGGPLLGKVVRFSVPLMLNGAGTAFMTQGDRLFVGAFLGLETLGHYAVTILTVYVPTSGLFRLVGPLCFAGLINAQQPAIHEARLKLYSRVVPMLAAIYAVGWITLGKSFIPAAFGARFVVSDAEVLLLALIVYIRICRTEPAQSLLLQSHLTHRLAIGNQVPILGLGIGAVMTWLHPALESLLAGMAIGEVLTLMLVLRLAKKVWRGAWRDAVVFSFAMILMPAVFGALFVTMGTGDHLLMRIALGLAAMAIIAIIGLFIIPPLVKVGYRSQAPNLQTETDETDRLPA